MTTFTKFWIILFFVTVIYAVTQFQVMYSASKTLFGIESFESLNILFIPIAICAAILSHLEIKETHKRSLNLSDVKEKRHDQAGLYFPDPGKSLSQRNRDDFEQRIAPAFLIEQAEYGAPSCESKKIRSYLIWVDDYLIGADKSLCDLYLNDDSISLLHARILKRGHQYFLVDLGSKEGTWISHHKLYSHEETPLNENELIRIGNYRFLFSLSGNRD